MRHLLGHLQKTGSLEPSATSSGTIAYLAALDQLEFSCPPVAEAIIRELKDQRSFLKLIASENYSSLAVQLAMGNLLTDKYAEGYPFHRFYAGCDQVDTLESLAQDELMKLYGAESAYVQPHSGADANLVAFSAALMQKVQLPFLEKLSKKTIDELSPVEFEEFRQLFTSQKLMGMSLNSGGHLTHGYRHNLSSKLFRAVAYEVDPKTERLDYHTLQQQVLQEKPTLLIAGYSAYPRRINFATMREIADSVGAVLLVDMAHFSGLVAGGVFQGEENPVPFAHLITSTTHKTLRGPRGGFVLAKKEFSDAVNKGCPSVLGGPLPHVMAAKLIAFQEANTSSFRAYAHKIVENARAMAEAFLEKGVRLVTGGTDNHLLIVDVSPFGLTGRQAENALRTSAITANRNTIPNDRQGPWYTSGLRLGTAAITTLGMGKEEARQIAHLIYEVLSHTESVPSPKTGLASKAACQVPEAIQKKAREETANLLSRFPLYPEITLD